MDAPSEMLGRALLLKARVFLGVMTVSVRCASAITFSEWLASVPAQTRKMRSPDTAIAGAVKLVSPHNVTFLKE